MHNTFYREGFFGFVFFFFKDSSSQWATCCILAMIQDHEKSRENRHGCMGLGLMGHREPWAQEERAQGKSRGVETPGLGLTVLIAA